MTSSPNPLGFVSHLPVAMDGSNNGLQIYSIALRDEIGATATNCVPLEAPRDAYQDVADVTTEKLREYKEHGEEPKKRRWAREVLAFCERQGLEGLPRSAVKRSVMTQPYGSTKYSCQAYVVEWYHDYVRGLSLDPSEHPFPHNDAYNVFRWVGDIVWDSIGDVVVKAREAMEWIPRGLWDPCGARVALHLDDPAGLQGPPGLQEGHPQVRHSDHGPQDSLARLGGG